MTWKGPLTCCVLFVAFLSYCLCQDCVEYFEEADSMFKQPEVMPKQFENSQIVNLTLVERRSYYRCEPAEEKYGIGLDGKEWWVFHGCGGIFEVTECSPDGQPLVMKEQTGTMTQDEADKKANTKLATDGSKSQPSLNTL